jgi:hypothetical protein
VESAYPRYICCFGLEGLYPQKVSLTCNQRAAGKVRLDWTPISRRPLDSRDRGYPPDRCGCGTCLRWPSAAVAVCVVVGLHLILLRQEDGGDGPVGFGDDPNKWTSLLGGRS